MLHGVSFNAILQIFLTVLPDVLCVLWLQDPVSGQETVKEFGPNDFIVIPARYAAVAPYCVRYFVMACVPGCNTARGVKTVCILHGCCTYSQLYVATGSTRLQCCQNRYFVVSITGSTWSHVLPFQYLPGFDVV